MNEYYITITGKSPIAHPIDEEKEISVAFKRLACYRIDKSSNNEGGYSYNYKYKNLDEITIIEGEKVILGKGKERRSKALRKRIWIHGKENEPEKDETEYYEQVMNKIITNLDEIIAFINKEE